MTKYLRYPFYIIILLLLSCEKEISLEGEPVNIYSGASRNNSYERFGDFCRQLYFVDSYDSIVTGGAIAPLLALSGYKIVFPSSNGEIIFFDNREMKWHAKLDSDRVASAGLCADPNQNIYVIDNEGMLYSFSHTGNLRWNKYFNKISQKDIVTFSDLLALKDGIVAASSDGKIVKYNFAGKILWEKQYNSAILKYFPADENGNIILALTKNIFEETDTLVYLSSKGQEIWKKYFKNSRIIKPPVYSKSKIYFICLELIGDEKYPSVYCLNTKGKTLWKKELSLLPRFLSVDSDDRMYIAAYNTGMGKPVSMVACFDKYGKKLWDKYIEVAINSPLMIAENIIAFTGSDNAASGVYFMRKNGFLENVISLSEAPILNMQPLVTPNRHILFGGAEKVQILRIDETPMKKFIPW